ncbi:MAG: hypothetical protein EP346_12700 [Bacteroidetes bacterium]|nr:MAG: hypothetical protein EP346_12700 [Bacteroidota bacterium]
MSLLFSAFLAVMLLVVPCKVRNAIETALDIPTTSVTNKSQTTHHSCCVERMDAIASVETSLSQPITLGLEPSEIFDLSCQPLAGEQFHVEGFNVASIGIDVPLYILYQNYKVYL